MDYTFVIQVLFDLAMRYDLVAYFLLSLWGFWALYVFSMGIYRAKLSNRLTGINKILGYPIFLAAAIIDAFFNITVATVLFLDLPREFLVTTRLQKYIKKDTGWRNKIAKWLCDSVLDPFDPDGDHC